MMFQNTLRNSSTKNNEMEETVRKKLIALTLFLELIVILALYKK